MSARQEIAQRLATFIIDNGLCEVFGGDVGQDTGKKGKPYSVAFSVARFLDGCVWVYSPKFIQVGWSTPWGHLPQRDAFVFESEAHALDFMKRAFVDLDGAALDVPRKQKT